jgi:hypothetical protein
MVTNLILLVIAAAIFFGYTYSYVYRTVGILKSVSDSVYHVKNTIWFQLTMMLFPIPFIIAAENVSTTWIQQFTAFFAGGLICFVGVTACIKRGDKTEETIHVIGATGGILLGTVWVATFGWLFATIALLFTLFVLYCHFVSKYNWWKEYTNHTAILSLNKFKRFLVSLPIVHNHTWIIEVVAVCMILGVVLIQSLKL